MRKIWGAAGLAALALTVSACASSASSSPSAASTPAAGTGPPLVAGGGAANYQKKIISRGTGTGYP